MELFGATLLAAWPFLFCVVGERPALLCLRDRVNQLGFAGGCAIDEIAILLAHSFYLQGIHFDEVVDKRIVTVGIAEDKIAVFACSWNFDGESVQRTIAVFDCASKSPNSESREHYLEDGIHGISSASE